MARVADYTFDDPAASPSAADTAGPTAQTGTFQGDASTDGAGNGVFDGAGDYVEIAPDPALDLAEGTLILEFTQASASTGDNPWGGNAAQTLFSVDSTGFDAGGHLTIYIKSNGEVAVRHQTDSQSFEYSGGSVSPGTPVSVGYSWGPDGSTLVVDGQTVATGTQPLVMTAGTEPLVIGASQAQSGDGTADNLKGFFDGTIGRVQIHDEAIVTSAPVPCFTAGTRILTPRGPVRVELLRFGDLVVTHDHGPLPIRALRTTVIDPVRLSLFPRLRPIRIKCGALGARADLLVSRQHCLLWRGAGGEEVLIRAAHLARFGGPQFSVDPGEAAVTYVHLLLDRHAIITANGAMAETLLPGAQGTSDRRHTPCRPICNGREARARLATSTAARSLLPT